MPEVTTPSNIEYMILGYGLAALIMGALVGYMMLKLVVCAKRPKC